MIAHTLKQWRQQKFHILIFGQIDDHETKNKDKIEQKYRGKYDLKISIEREI